MLGKCSAFEKMLLILLAVSGLAACSANQKTGSPIEETAQVVELNVGMLIVGDAGNIEVKPSMSALVPVSSAIKNFCKENSCDFGVMPGDNIYPRGADGAADGLLDADRFRRAFKEPFSGLLDGNQAFRFYSALGNHDWYNSRAGALAQVSYSEKTPPMFMDGLFYTVKPEAANGAIEIFVVDTEMMMAAEEIQFYKLDDEGVPYATKQIGRGGHENAMPQTAKEKGQLSWLSQALKKSDAQWKFIVAHHPLWESKGSKHQQSIVLRKILRPMVCQYADAYFAGHQHTLEVHTDSCDGTGRDTKRSELIHLVSGSAGKSRKLNQGYMKWQAENFPELTVLDTIGGVWGYMYATVTDVEFKVDVRAADEGDADLNSSILRYSKTFKKS